MFNGGGNGNTLSISKYDLDVSGDTPFRSTHTPTYKQIIDFNDSGKSNLISFDTGSSGNVLSKHYFDMNEDHMGGKMHHLETNFKEMKDQQFYQTQIVADAI